MVSSNEPINDADVNFYFFGQWFDQTKARGPKEKGNTSVLGARMGLVCVAIPSVFIFPVVILVGFRADLFLFNSRFVLPRFQKVGHFLFWQDEGVFVLP